MAIDGTWVVKYPAPGGERQSDLVLSADESALTGSFDGTPIDGGETDGTNFTYTVKITTPIKAKAKCSGSVDGETISGKVKAAFLTANFKGVRKDV